ncbi:xanthine dehydrogenase accessory factor [Muricomes intestini]|uniref:Xanthine dehydrogenase accessory factor n=1 Tax=Muricomes intestini TaxID=1796634 RepID=A0A4R3KB50_9FIRM|nr:selenium-dependent molybdenum cofactor biosynthesis protein YqeB [Muricomes intestini]TCS80225.1 xanthine dehydrogenase accessory factor [Muricomes intestini]
MRILIRGAGDLATGIASRLYHGGHQIIMTEIAVPLTVRRMVAFSRAVYEGRAEVEDMTGILVHSMEEANAVIQDGDIPIIVDEKAEIVQKYKPDVIVDAILAKKNLGTRMTDAPFVIGVGPGFTAGLDCHCVVETKRGHTLGMVLYDGSAIPNTGVPGNIGGFTTERLIRAGGNGLIEPVASIGDMVEKGQVVAVTGGQKVYAQMSGIVRGMLQPGVQVWKNLKIGDIDARCEKFHCFTISDKARSIGGGVLEAVTGFENIRNKYAIVVLAAGRSLRFGGENKLLTTVSGKPLYEHTLARLEGFWDFSRFVVTGYHEIEKRAEELGMHSVINLEPELGISHSIQMGLKACLEENPDIQGVLFSVCDQPKLHPATIQRLLNTAGLHKGQIICTANQGRPGNPVLWDRKFFPKLMSLSGDNGGKQIMAEIPEKIRYVEAHAKELHDIDYKSDISDLDYRE